MIDAKIILMCFFISFVPQVIKGTVIFVIFLQSESRSHPPPYVPAFCSSENLILITDLLCYPFLFSGMTCLKCAERR